MSGHKTWRELKAKRGNLEYTSAMQELRRSNAAQPHRNKSRYTRKRKHRDQPED